MTNDKKKTPPTKKDKLAEALRANLMKRKQQARARDYENKNQQEKK